MKKALSLLVAFIFLQTQTWALSGGPIFTSTTSNDLTGVYSGVMAASTLNLAAGAVVPPLGTASSIGVFTITVPISGAAVGAIAYFQAGSVYTGTINGAANAANRSITGIVQATSTDVFTVVASTPAVPAGPSVVVTPPPLFIPIVVPGTPAIPATAAITSALTSIGNIQAKVSQPTNRGNSGNQAVDGVLRSANSAAGGVDADGNPVSLGQGGDRLSGKATMYTKITNTAVVGVPVTVSNATYSISGVRQTNAFASTGGLGGG